MEKVVKLKDIKDEFSNSVDKIHDLCKNEIYDINQLITEKLISNVKLVNEIANYIFISGGKRLRPLITIACSKMLGYGFKKDQIDHIDLAAAIEFIHTATLMHDDVVDESLLRRGNLSSNEIWGNKTSVLIGDFLFSRAFQLMAKDKSGRVLKLLSDTSVTISEGEVLELSYDKDPTLSENEYLEVINGKTASLFSASSQVAGIIAKIDRNKEEALKTFGKNFGMCFQLIDDALDYSSSTQNLGKNVGDDFKEGKITMPIILSYLRSDKMEKKFWQRTIKNLNQKQGDFLKAKEIINKYNCIEDTILRAKHFSNIAIDSLGIFDDNKYKNSLLELVRGSLKRIK